MKNGKFFISFIVFLFIGFSFSNAQLYNKSEEERNKEHQAVIELLEKAMNAPAKKHSDIQISKINEKTIPLTAGRIGKITAQSDRKSYFMNGNRISVEIYNYGGIAPGYDALRGVNNFVWKNLDYLFQFCPIVGASVPNPDTASSRIAIISDGLWDYPNLREVNPAGDSLWQWQPLPGYADPDLDLMASNPADDNDGDGKPDSWPREWYNSTLGQYVWPGYLSQNASNADLEVYWAMDDRDNKEYGYRPYLNDTTKGGLGIQVDGRAFQWSNALAENTIFFVYSVTNVSDKHLDSVFFGIYGDPDMGGGSPENTDDRGFFVPPYSTPEVNVDNIPVYARSMVYFFDQDKKGRSGLPLGYLGCKYLESPGDPTNGIDDDGDGMIDERQDDGIDNDEDWNPDVHDVGIDGIKNTNDEGEGDGFPTSGLRLPDGSPDPLYPGEPNFEYTDLDEADQIGLTSFNSWTWGDDEISNDRSMWNRSIPGNFGDIQQETDLVFILASGYISLDPGETKRISMALLVGENYQDLLITAETVQRIYNENYQFFRPPLTPTVTAVAGDKKVNLYWDRVAENSFDPITGKDFEGYVIYRSTDYNFSDIRTITDGQGSSFLSEPLTKLDGTICKWDIDEFDEPFTDVNKNGRWDKGEPFVDLTQDAEYSYNEEDLWFGYHPIPYQGRGVQYYLGDNTGLVHQYEDSNEVINGQTYYYAVVAFDHGDSIGIPPTETTKKISLDPITNELKFDKNTVAVIPGSRSTDYVAPMVSDAGIVHESGISTGEISIRILDDLKIRDNVTYRITFSDSLLYDDSYYVEGKNYSILDLSEKSQTVILYDTLFAQLEYRNIANDDLFSVSNNNGTVYQEGIDYVMDYTRGSLRRLGGSSMPNEGTFNVKYRNYPLVESTDFSGSGTNDVFDGIVVNLYDEPDIEFDQENSRWISGGDNRINFGARPTSVSLPNKEKYPGDFEITFSDVPIDSAIWLDGSKIPVVYTVKEVSRGIEVPILTFLNESQPKTRNGEWDLGEAITLFKPGSTGKVTDTLTWDITVADTLGDLETPGNGDVLFIRLKKPFTTNDVYSFVTTGFRTDNQKAANALDNVIVVPNPYVGYNELEPVSKLPGQLRGERRIYFDNLPNECTIRIFTLSGNLVNTLNHYSNYENGREYWNLLNKDGFSVAYGIYIAHIDAPGIGEKILKFAIIK